MKIALNQNTILQCNLPVFAECCMRAGFDAVELRYSKVQEALAFLSKKSIKKLFQDYGIEILSLNALEDALLVPDDNIGYLAAEANLIAATADSLDCRSVVVPSSRWLAEWGPPLFQDQVVRTCSTCLAEIKRVFDKYQIKALFEPIGYTEFVVGNPQWTNLITGVSDLRSIPIVVDVHNLFINGEGPDQIRLFTNPIGLFHIDDTLSVEGSKLDVAKSRTFPGEGVANVAEWVKEAQGIGYDGFFSLELFDERVYQMDPREAAGLCRSKLKWFENAL